MPRQGTHQVAQISTATTWPRRSLVADAAPAVQAVEGDGGQGGDLAPLSRVSLGARRLFMAGEDQGDDAGEVGAEALLARRARERRIAAAAVVALAAAVEAEVLGRRHQDVVDEDGGVSLDAETRRERGGAVVLHHEADLAAELFCHALSQQTCRIGEVSRVGPAHQGDGDRGLLRRRRGAAGGFEGGEVARQHVAGERRGDRGVAGRRARRVVGLRYLEEEPADAVVDLSRAEPAVELRGELARQPWRARRPAARRRRAQRAGRRATPAGSAAGRRSAGLPR